MDEKGFLLGIIHASKRIVPIRALKKGLTRGQLQDGSREFITLIGAINTMGNTVPPALIYASESGDLQDTWVDDFDQSTQNAYFGTSQTGWTNDQLGLNWLERFHESTFQIAGYQKRLLVLDGHSSYLTIAFL
jgi:hypothetical protein